MASKELLVVKGPVNCGIEEALKRLSLRHNFLRGGFDEELCLGLVTEKDTLGTYLVGQSLWQSN